MAMIALSQIQAARERIRSQVQTTPVVSHWALSELLGCQVYLKLEVLQLCGMFKTRGAFNKMLGLSQAEQKAGVVAVSGGNHAIAVSHVAKAMGLEATLVMPASTPANYLEATLANGAKVELAPSAAEAFAKAQQLKQQGLSFVHPFDDPEVIAGQGTLGLELLEQIPSLSDVVVSIGGGGLMGGVVSAIKALKPEVRIWGVETEGADAMSQALAAGHPVQLSNISSIAKTLGAPSVTERTLAIAQHLEKVLRVSDKATVGDLLYLLEQAKVMCEPAAACTLTAAKSIAPKLPKGAHLALILCGGNASLEQVQAWKTQFGYA